MKAKVGDRLVIKGTTIDPPDQRGLITEMHSPDGSPPHVGRRHESGHVVTAVFPGPDAVVVTAEEQEEAGEWAQHRCGAAGDSPQQRPVGGFRVRR